MTSLAEIENQMAELTVPYADYARKAALIEAQQREMHGVAYEKATGNSVDRRAMADRLTAGHGMEDLAMFKALKVKFEALEKRSMIGMSILRAQSKA